jgi:hypothetical protein
MGFYSPNSENKKFTNIAYTSQTSSVEHFIKNEQGLLSHILVNYVSGSSVDNILLIKDGYLSSSLSASVPQTPVLSFDAKTVGTIHLGSASVGEEFEYNLVFNQGLVVVTNPSASADITVIYE